MNSVVAAAGMAVLAAMWSLPRPISALPGRRSADTGVRRRAVVGAAALGLGATVVADASDISVSGAIAAMTATAVCAVAAHTILGSARRRRQRVRRRQQVIEVCDALVAEMRAGLPAQQAVLNACGPWPELDGIAATVRLGGDVAAAFAKAALRPGAEGLRLVAAGWHVSGRSGAGLAAVLDRIALTLRADEDAHAEVIAALGPPRATAKLLATLPVVGLALGTAMGVDPLDFLVTSGIGNACLAAGLSLAMLGLWWVERLADAVET